MLRPKLFYSALVALVSSLFTAATSQAGFVVSVYVDNNLAGSFNAVQNPITGLWSVSNNVTYGTAADYVTLDFSAQSNLPGGAQAYVLDTTTNITSGGSSATNHNIVIRAEATPFTSPGGAGSQLFLFNRITSVGGTGVNGPNSPNLDVYGEVDPDGNAGTDDSIRTGFHTYTPNIVNGFAVYDSNSVQFNRGNEYSLATVIDLDLRANRTAQITTQAMVVTPAPAGLIMAATALPFVGLLRRRLRAAPPTT